MPAGEAQEGREKPGRGPRSWLLRPHSPGQLIQTGAKQAFLRLKEKYPKVCLMHLCALEGAVQNMEFNRLPEETKKELKEFSDF